MLRVKENESEKDVQPKILYNFIYEFIEFVSVHDLLLARSVSVYLFIYFVKCICENPLRLFVRVLLLLSLCTAHSM